MGLLLPSYQCLSPATQTSSPYLRSRLFAFVLITHLLSQQAELVVQNVKEPPLMTAAVL